MVYAKTPLGGPAQVLEYLSRYTHRTAISNERIRAVNDCGVAFTVRADDHGANCNAKRLVRMDGTEFVRRFLLHILPAGAGGAGALAWTGLHRGASQPGAAMSFCLGLDQ